jgi:DNA replication protein
MPTFNGFSEGKTRFTPVPAQLFSELLADIDHLGELKVVLYALWQLDHMEGVFRCLEREDFTQDKHFMSGMGKNDQAAHANLDEALDRAVNRGVLLRASTAEQESAECWYFLNSPKGRAAVEAFRQGKWHPSTTPRFPASLKIERPNIFRLYEEHVGPLTPMLAESLRDAAEEYPHAWIEDAFRIAVDNNKRSWKYIEAILRRWQEGGKDEQNRRDTEKDRRRYAEWESSER